ncbi:ATP-binding protein [Clostridium butyricum]|uniref:ATP-binding protein n=1 Tax=Clostridium butyricum TaxID=1492 RepID=UPI0024BBAB90|nr:ATP-binding protein [Clostridium butyricum]
MEQVLTTFNYALVLIYGVLLTVDFANEYITKKQRYFIFFFITLLLLTQTFCGFIFGLSFTQKIYPFISHVPLVLILVIYFKKKLAIAVVSVLTAYFYCQLPRWVGSIAEFVFGVRLAYLIVYTVSIVIFYFILKRYFSIPAYYAMTYSRRSLFLFGCLPLFYYLFDYLTTVYTDMLYEGVTIIAESLPAAMAMFYILFIVMYHNEVQKRNKIELYNTILSMQLAQTSNDIQNVKRSEEVSRIYRHDLRHHLSLLYAFAESGNIDKIKDYLLQTKKDLDNITPIIFCENDIVNLLLSFFDNKAKKVNITLITKVKLPKNLDIPDTEFCSILSNGLENAIAAVSKIDDVSLRTVHLNCFINKNKLLIMIQNSYLGEIQKKDGIPASLQDNHGFGCRSIVMIAEKQKGFATFETEENIFTLRVILPL